MWILQCHTSRARYSPVEMGEVYNEGRTAPI